MLEALGLNWTESSVYQSMLMAPEREITKFAEDLGVPDAAITCAVETLLAMRLLRPCHRRPGEFRAVSPELGFQAILRRREAELAQHQHEYASAQAAIATVTAACHRVAAASTERIIGQPAVQARMEALAAQTEFECISIIPDGALSPELFSTARSINQGILTRGKRVLALFQECVRRDESAWAYAHWLAKAGGQVRLAPVLPARMLISDRRVALVPLDPDDLDQGAVCIWEPGIISTLATMFDHVWSNARPLPSSSDGKDEGTGLAPGEHALLRLLATGLTDGAAANRLGISPRTARRQVAALMSRLGASSRFQAGAQAASNGWLARH
jgi:sugar-specific transcriptional regulator TrmB/DNA-binding CsgD family transcriptional regulator